MCVCVCSGVGRFKKFSVNQVTFSTFWKPSPIICWRCTHTRGRALPGAHPRSPARRRHGTARPGIAQPPRARSAVSARGAPRGAGSGAARGQLPAGVLPAAAPRLPSPRRAERSGAERNGAGPPRAGGGRRWRGGSRPPETREGERSAAHTHTHTKLNK